VTSQGLLPNTSMKEGYRFVRRGVRESQQRGEEGYVPVAFRWRCGSGTTPPHSTQRTFPALCSSSVTLSEIRRLWVQAQEGLMEMG
jgi:hypothetical protein